MQQVPEQQIGEFSVKYRKGILYLWERNHAWMSLETADVKTQQFAVKDCTGKVLIGGLGLGVVVEGLAKKPNVSMVVVVEIAPEVKSLVWPYLNINGKCKILIDDIKSYLQNTTERFDYIYLDTHKNEGRKEYENVVLPLRRLAEKIVPPDKVLIWQEKQMKEKYQCTN